LIVALLAHPAYADDPPSPQNRDDLSTLSLEDLLEMKVYAASRFVQDMSHAPASVSIVGADEIRRHGYRTIADILRTVRGFYISYDRNYRYVGVRGFARPGDFNSRVLLLVNGHRLNDIVFEQALIGTESPIDVALIDRVEIVRGPSSSLYGTSAFLAVVNVVTRNGQSMRGGEVEGVFGSQQARGGRVTAGGVTAAGLDGLFSASGFASDGQARLYFPSYDMPGQGDGIASGVDGDRGGTVFGSLARGSISVQGGYSSRTKVIPTGAYSTIFNDDRTRTTDARAFIDADYTRPLRPRTTLQASLSFDSYRYRGSYAYDEGLLRDTATGDWINAEAMVEQEYRAHGLTAGGHVRANFRQDQTAEDHTGLFLDDHRDEEIAALFLQDEWHLGRRVVLNAGVRWDHYFDTFDSALSPRLALILFPRQRTTIKALYGRAFRAPNPYELYYDQNPLSATLHPEQITTYEMVWEERVAAAMQLTASAFDYRARDLISQVPGETAIDIYYRNIDTAHARGLELELQTELPWQLRARLSQVVQSVTDANTRQRLSNSPATLSSAVIEAPIGRTGTVVGFNSTMVGRRATIGGGRVARAWVWDVTLSRLARTRGVSLTLSVNNLFDASYADPGSVEHLEQSIPQDGRTASLRASWKF
jgi:outer membrane receptor for ferrienterochelin and colicins